MSEEHKVSFNSKKLKCTQSVACSTLSTAKIFAYAKLGYIRNMLYKFEINLSSRLVGDV